MNVFGILSSDDEETLTEENYCEKTNKDKPYYRPDISPISPYFAICPSNGTGKKNDYDNLAVKR